MGDIKFSVNEEKRRVICFLYNCDDIAIKRIKKYAPCFDITKYKKKLRVDSLYIGVARCAPEDEFDEAFGKRLALSRAKAKRCRAVNNVIYDVLDHMENELDSLDAYGIHDVPEIEK